MSILLHASPISPALPSDMADKPMDSVCIDADACTLRTEGLLDSVYIDADACTLRTEGLLARGLDSKLLINSLPLD